MEPEEALVNDVLKFHSRELDLRGFQSCLSKFSIGKIYLYVAAVIQQANVCLFIRASY